MEFNEKLQELRKQKGLTQEELATALFVSRTAVSKWESGRGYPNIDSLKAIAKFFCITVDELLSTEQALTIAQEDQKEKKRHIRSLVFGLLDLSVVLFLFVPIFGQRTDGGAEAVPLLQLTQVSGYLKIGYFVIVIGSVLWGILTLILQNYPLKCKTPISILITAVSALLFIVSRQPTGATLMLVFLAVKVLMIRKVSSL